MQQVLDNLNELPTCTGAKDIDLIFLRGIMESPIVRSLAKAHERLEEVKLEAVRDNNVELVSEILEDISPLASRDDSAAELSRILKEPHFQSLLEAHDKVASKSYEPPPGGSEANHGVPAAPQAVQADAVRMIGIRKKAGEPLGVTFRVENSDLVIARILHGGMIDRQGLLHVGDIIKEVNGKDVGSNPKELQDMLKSCCGGITLKILPSYRDAALPQQVYVKPHFDYNPASDTLIPCKEAGLSFSRGDVLQIVNREDPNWWQACHVVGGSTGLIPSQFLEHGEYEGNLYGTKIDSILEVVQTGRTCILDVNPQALKVLKTPEFMPYVVFIAAPELDTLRAMHKAVVDAGITTKLLTDTDLKKTVDESARIQRAYSHYFDLTIVNDNLDKAFEQLQAAVDRLCTEPQWVPVSWVY